MLSVVVPVLNEIKITDDFLASILANTVPPDEIILIDNGSTDDIKSLVSKYPGLNIVYVRNDVNIGVNASWNQGVRLAERSIVSILNNDLLLNKYFFAKILETMENSRVGMCVPQTIPEGFPPGEEEPVVLVNMPRREGWAFTIRKEIITEHDNFIPKELKTWYGDDFLHARTKELGYHRFKMLNNAVFHYGGVTLKKEFPPGSPKTRELVAEGQAYASL